LVSGEAKRSTTPGERVAAFWQCGNRPTGTSEQSRENDSLQNLNARVYRSVLAVPDATTFFRKRQSERRKKKGENL